MGAFVVFLILISFANNASSKLTPDAIATDLDSKMSAIRERWNSDQRKWFDYKFDPHYDVARHDLQHGTEIPAFGINAELMPTENVFESLVFAMRLGYRFIHTSLDFDSYEYVAKSVGMAGVHRSSLFISLSIGRQYFGYKNVIESMRAYVQQTEFKYIDLCVMDSPETLGALAAYEAAMQRRLTWTALEQLHADGICTNIGVAHFGKSHLEELWAFANVKPAVNLMEMHPYNTREKLRTFLIRKQIITIAENVLDPSNDHRLLKEPLIRKLASKYAKTPSQIMLKWAVQQGFVVLPSDHRKQQIADNAQIMAFELEYNDLYDISQLNRDESFSNGRNISQFKWTTKSHAEFQTLFDSMIEEYQQQKHELYKAYRRSLEKEEL